MPTTSSPRSRATTAMNEMMVPYAMLAANCTAAGTDAPLQSGPGPTASLGIRPAWGNVLGGYRESAGERRERGSRRRHEQPRVAGGGQHPPADLGSHGQRGRLGESEDAHGRASPSGGSEITGERGGRGAECRQADAVDDTPEEQTRDRPNGPVAERRNDVDPGSGDQESAAPRPVHPDAEQWTRRQRRESQYTDDQPHLRVRAAKAQGKQGEGREEEVERREVEER